MFGYHKAIALLATALAITAMGMVAGLFHLQYWSTLTVAKTCNSSSNSSSASSSGVLNASCTPLGADECSGGILVTTPSDGDICLPARAPTGTACTNRCYMNNAVTPVCDGATGECTGAVTECLGYCNATTVLNQTIPFDTNWLAQTDVVTGVPIVWNYYFDCYWNSVRLFVLDLCWTTETGNTGSIAGCRNECTDYLTPEFVASGMPEACLVKQSEFLLDPNMTAPGRYLNDPNHLPQFRLCTLGYRCASLNQTAIAANNKRSTDTAAADDHQAIARELLATSARFSSA